MKPRVVAAATDSDDGATVLPASLTYPDRGDWRDLKTFLVAQRNWFLAHGIADPDHGDEAASILRASKRAHARYQYELDTLARCQQRHQHGVGGNDPVVRDERGGLAGLT